jgi:NAD(P)-dependent dehydrogenase (short-subunit alcohol dehydrogenase family)
VTESRTALVTGARRGIGAAIARRLAADGLDVVTLDLRDGCDISLDVAEDPFPPLGEIDVCVANAAITTTIASAHRMTPEQWRRDIDVNLTGAFRTIQACLGGMRERRHGRIVVISSVAATDGMPAQVAYSASKAGLLGMVKTVAAENASHGITANAILPGLVATAGVVAMPQPIIDAWLSRIPIGRLAEPAEIAAAASFFASPGAGSVTGQELVIDGGQTLNSLSVTSSVMRQD